MASRCVHPIVTELVEMSMSLVATLARSGVLRCPHVLSRNADPPDIGVGSARPPGMRDACGGRSAASDASLIGFLLSALAVQVKIKRRRLR